MTKWSDMRVKLACVVCCILAISGCATYSAKSADMRSSLLSGQFAMARDLAEKQSSEKDVLAALNKGMLRRMTGDYIASNQIFEQAKRRIGDLYGVSVSDQLGAVTISDTLRDFQGDRYEQVLLHAYMAMNYIQIGDIDAARVEMLQADVKMREWGEAPEEDPFVRYLSGIIFEMLGESDQALVSYRKAYEIYKSSSDRLGLATPQIVKQDLLRLLATEELWDEYRRLKTEFGMPDFKPVKTAGGYGEVIVVLNNGLAPQREENAIMTFSNEVSQMVRIALPAYRYRPAQLTRARINVDGRQQRLETVENVDALARHALNDDIALITTRAIARAVIKHKTQREVQDKHGGLAGLLMTVTNLATERADTRSWTTLPQEIQLTRLLLPEGQHQVNIEMVNAAGRVVDSMQQTVTIKSGQRTLLSEHWVAPAPVISAKSK
ncbi:MAG: hypothetical protein WBN96_00175 [Gammaproteobacteria bacterium]